MGWTQRRTNGRLSPEAASSEVSGRRPVAGISGWIDEFNTIFPARKQGKPTSF